MVVNTDDVAIENLYSQDLFLKTRQRAWAPPEFFAGGGAKIEAECSAGFVKFFLGVLSPPSLK